jgi:cysteinyl-tRNA synthetase
MLIYNTMNRKKEIFEPIEPEKVNMYVCGPTVYDFFHIGNGRTFVMADIIRRYLEYKKFKVNFVMNVTDVDDKIIKKSIEEKVDSNVIAKRYTDAFFEDIAKLKIKKATLNPKATEHMKEIIDLIKSMEEKGYAYNNEGNVFYDVKKFKGYGKLSGKNIDELESGARVEINDEKKDPLDFALWKKAKEGEPSWESPWGNGRPGWHIECSAMSTKHLGKTIDIHGGGSDLIFPHHENEIAQSEAANGQEFVKYWIHFGFLNFQNEKMSKSLGNFFTVRDVVKKFPAEVIRFFFSQAHYAAQLNFSDDLLLSAQNGLEKIQLLYDKCLSELNNPAEGNDDFDFGPYYKEFEEPMDDDFNTPQAVAAIFNFVKAANKKIAEEKNTGSRFYAEAKKFLDLTAAGVLGIINESKSEGNIELENNLINLLIELRKELKLQKNYAMADEVRDRLLKIGIQLEDGKAGTSFRKINVN